MDQRHSDPTYIDRSARRTNDEREASPSGGYEYVFYMHDCPRPDCHQREADVHPPDSATRVCGAHSSDEVQTELGVKL